jgi:hypothetical protein
VKEFNYLGILLTNKENFKRELKTLAEKGTKSNVGNSEKRRMPQSFYVMST